MIMAHILFIEDDRDLALSYSLMFEDRGHTVTWHRTGEEALESRDITKADIVVCDMALPGMDGAAVCRAIKQLEETRGLPIILFTCVRVKYAIDISERDRAWIPADRIIDKGDTPAVLLDALDRMLGSKGVTS